jgi:16S rRNA (cytosine1402-N4)-methyltransferase
VDCTLGFGGHARELLARIAPGGRLIGLDVDPIEHPKTTARLRSAGWGEEVFTAVRSNFAGLPKVLAELGLDGVDAILADLGVSSMQLDDPARGFTFKADSPLDLRMNPSRPPSAADWLARVSPLIWLPRSPKTPTNPMPSCWPASSPPADADAVHPDAAARQGDPGNPAPA